MGVGVETSPSSDIGGIGRGGNGTHGIWTPLHVSIVHQMTWKVPVGVRQGLAGGDLGLV